MIPKLISHAELKKAIEISFNNDKDIFRFFDPNVKVETLSDIVENILQKIDTYPNAKFYGVYNGGKLVGYFIYRDKQLISFALSIEFRTRSYLRAFFKIIKSTIKGHFMCLLWSRNTRAIKWLLKNKMEVINQDKQIIQLAI